MCGSRDGINACHLIANLPTLANDVHRLPLEQWAPQIMACCVVQILFITYLLKIKKKSKKNEETVFRYIVGWLIVPRISWCGREMKCVFAHGKNENETMKCIMHALARARALSYASVKYRIRSLSNYIYYKLLFFSFLCSLAVANAASSQLVGLKRLYILFRNYTKVRTNSLANATHAHSIFARVALCVGVRRASHVITSRLHLDDNS